MLKSSEGVKVKTVGTVAPDWKNVGILMNLDPTARKVGYIETDHAHKRDGSVICCQEIFRVWLDSPDATWGNLIKLLIDAEHTTLAEQVKKCTRFVDDFHFSCLFIFSSVDNIDLTAVIIAV